MTGPHHGRSCGGLRRATPAALGICIGARTQHRSQPLWEACLAEPQRPPWPGYTKYLRMPAAALRPRASRWKNSASFRRQMQSISGIALRALKASSPAGYIRPWGWHGEVIRPSEMSCRTSRRATPHLQGGSQRTSLPVRQCDVSVYSSAEEGATSRSKRNLEASPGKGARSSWTRRERSHVLQSDGLGHFWACSRSRPRQTGLKAKAFSNGTTKASMQGKLACPRTRSARKPGPATAKQRAQAPPARPSSQRRSNGPGQPGERISGRRYGPSNASGIWTSRETERSRFAECSGHARPLMRTRHPGDRPAEPEDLSAMARAVLTAAGVGTLRRHANEGGCFVIPPVNPLVPCSFHRSTATCCILGRQYIIGVPVYSQHACGNIYDTHNIM